MFQIGMSFRFSEIASTGKRQVVAISAVGIAVPFALGLATAPWFLERMAEPRPDALSFRLFFAVAVAFAGKFGGTCLAARLTGCVHR
jgi:Kef-type K+ transport system membrane component KefB